MVNLVPEISALQEKLHSRPLPVELKSRCEKLINRLGAVSQMSGGNQSSYSIQEFEILSKYIDWVTALPFGSYTRDILDLTSSKAVLDSHHYGLSGVKENVLEYLSVQILKSRTVLPQEHNQGMVSAPVLCFVGVQGVGKTTMAKSIAESLGRTFVRIALGAFADARELRGRSKSELGSEPGQIVKALIKARTMNPVILLDEIDKVSDSGGVKADVMATLLEVLDPEQNRQFSDRYLDYPVDLGQVLFIATANNISGLSAALTDRLELIRFTSYTDEEKQVIAKDYLLPKVRQDTGITAEHLDFADDVWPLIIRPLGFDPGIRQLERNLRSLARKVAKLIVEGRSGKITVTTENFREFFPETINVFT